MDPTRESDAEHMVEPTWESGAKGMVKGRNAKAKTVPKPSSKRNRTEERDVVGESCKRPTRKNTSLPPWSKSIDPKNLLGLNK